jgi:hypothetical protein
VIAYKSRSRRICTPYGQRRRIANPAEADDVDNHQGGSTCVFDRATK